MLDLSRDVAAKLERVAEIRQKAKTEKRDLSRREQAELDRIRTETENLQRQLPKFDPRSAQPGAHNAAAEITGDTLTREQRVSDWLRENGHYRGSSNLGGDDRANLSVGKMIRGALIGNWQDAEAEQRAMSENVLADGGYALGPELSSRVIDRVRNQMQVMRAGATTVPMTTQQMYLARLSGAANVRWKTEGATISDSTPTFERIVLTAKTLPVLCKISAELLEDASPEAIDTIERELSSALSLELDRAALRGSGIDPEPEGIRSASDVTITSLGANGATPSWDNVIDAVSTVRAANIEPNAILWSSRTQQTFDKFKDAMSRYLEPPSSLGDVARLVTNQIPNSLTAGTSSDASEIYVGRWSDLLVGMRTDLRFQVRVLSERYISELQYGLIAYLRADIALAHPQAFNVVTGVRP